MARVHSCEYKHSSALGLVKADELKMPNHERVNSGLDPLSQISQIIKVEKLSESSFSEPEELSQEDEKHLPLDIKKNNLKPRSTILEMSFNSSQFVGTSNAISLKKLGSVVSRDVTMMT
jgi:hypothetical protein